MTRTAGWLLVVAAFVVAGCSSDSGADPSTTDERVTTTEPSERTERPGTDATTTSSTTSTSTTTLPPTTTTMSPEQVEAEVAAAYLELDAKLGALLMAPSLEGLEARATAIAVPGSPYYQALVERVTTLVNNGQYLAPNQPDIRSVSVESVELAGGNAEAVVVACEVSNVVTMKGPDNSVIPGTPIPVGGTGDLAAYRLTQRVVKMADGWRHVGAPEATNQYWPEVTECPAS